MRLFDLSGRNALVTGSSQGIGLALAKGLAEAGARVVLNGRDEAKLAAAVLGLRDLGFTADQTVFDVTDPVRSRRQSPGWNRPSGPSTSWSTTPASSVGDRWRPIRWRPGARSWPRTSTGSSSSARRWPDG